MPRLAQKQWNFLFLAKYQSDNNSQSDFDDKHRNLGYRLAHEQDDEQHAMTPTTRAKLCLTNKGIKTLMPLVTSPPIYRDEVVSNRLSCINNSHLQFYLKVNEALHELDVHVITARNPDYKYRTHVRGSPVDKPLPAHRGKQKLMQVIPRSLVDAQWLLEHPN